MRYWENNGQLRLDGRYCLVIDPEDGTHPIKTYGRTKEEVLEKVAKTAEAAQQLINRQRSAQQSRPAVPARTEVSRPAPMVAPARALTADEQMQATADLSNPAKAPQAIKMLLRASGLDVDRMKFDEDMRRAARVAQEWENRNPDFPSDERNQQALMDKALLMVGGDFGRISSAIFDAAYNELLAQNRLFFDEPVSTSTVTPQMPPNGSSATRIVRPRGATSYRSTALRAQAPAARREQPRYTRAEVEAMSSREFREKMERETGFRDWYDRDFSSATR